MLFPPSIGVQIIWPIVLHIATGPVRQPETNHNLTNRSAAALDWFHERHPPCSVVAAFNRFDCPRGDVAPIRFGPCGTDQFNVVFGPLNDGIRRGLRNRLQHLSDDPEITGWRILARIRFSHATFSEPDSASPAISKLATRHNNSAPLLCSTV